ncbi:zinc-binding dehydrogenase [bacterium]|nr:zinc-binding dehydrogenase [bacterium]
MKALIYKGPWEMTLEEVAEPKPNPGEVLIDVKAIGICGSDVHGYTGSTGRRWPGMIMGHEFAGVVAAVTDGVSNYTVGDEVVVSPMFSISPTPETVPMNWSPNRRLLGVEVNGAYADRVTVKASQLFPKPAGLSWQQASLCEPLAVAMHAVQITPMDIMTDVAIIGSGTIGLLVLLAAKLKGAGRVIVIDKMPRRLEMAKQLGADIVINAGEQNAVDVVRELTSGGVDVTLEAVGYSATAQQAIDITRNGGNVTWIGNSAKMIEIDMQSVVTREITVRGTYAFTDYEFGKSIQAMAGGRIDVQPLIEKVAPLAEGPAYFKQLASGEIDLVKVVLEP